MKQDEFLELVVEINVAPTQLERRLRLAAVIPKILGPQMVVVGGTAGLGVAGRENVKRQTSRWC